VKKNTEQINTEPVRIIPNNLKALPCKIPPRRIRMHINGNLNTLRTEEPGQNNHDSWESLNLNSQCWPHLYIEYPI